MANYESLIATSLRLLEKNGREAIFLKPSTTPEDPNKPWNGPADDIDDDDASLSDEDRLTLNAVFANPGSSGTLLGEGTKFETLNVESDQILIVSPGEVDLREYISVIDRDIRWGIVGVQVLRPGPLTVLAFVGVKR